ncbi:hypothetical protein [Armatimonas sp.]|uniref:hypothetical protein n=1 Tax=Armatimonas sp. TaxID=1872638 RepID=UPI00374CEBC8
MEAEEREFGERLAGDLAVPRPPEPLRRRLQALAVATEVRPRPRLRHLSLVLAPAVVLVGTFYVRAHVPPLPAPAPLAASPDPKASPGSKASPNPKHPLPLGAESIPEPATLWLLLPGLPLLRRYCRSQITS